MSVPLGGIFVTHTVCVFCHCHIIAYCHWW